MRLLRAKDLTFFEVYSNIPPYAILSHTCGDDEVIIEDMLAGTGRQKKGFQKIAYCAEQAILDNLDYVWVDSCNIMRASSAELSEAINSMYQWYEGAEVCYVYLSDVDSQDIKDIHEERSKFRQSLWFTRGWTLPELLAPPVVRFFTKDWESIGFKRDQELCALVSSITGIDKDILQNGKIQSETVGARMVWASQRETTRPEDQAYCLLGIFDINLPLLYGEGGPKAFLRLQEEIWRKTEDVTMLFWTVPEDRVEADALDLKDIETASKYRSVGKFGPFAPLPVCFVPAPNETEYFQVADQSVNHFSYAPHGTKASLSIAPFHPRQDIYVASVQSDTSGYIFQRQMIILYCLNNARNEYARILTRHAVLEKHLPENLEFSVEPVHLVSVKDGRAGWVGPYEPRVKWTVTTSKDFYGKVYAKQERQGSIALEEKPWTIDITTRLYRPYIYSQAAKCISEFVHRPLGLLLTLYHWRSSAFRCFFGLEAKEARTKRSLKSIGHPQEIAVVMPHFFANSSELVHMRQWLFEDRHIKVEAYAHERGENGDMTLRLELQVDGTAETYTANVLAVGGSGIEKPDNHDEEYCRLSRSMPAPCECGVHNRSRSQRYSPASDTSSDALAVAAASEHIDTSEAASDDESQASDLYITQRIV